MSIVYLYARYKFVSDACGGYIDASNGTIHSPSYPDLYPPNKNCVWQIVAPAQYRITLTFTHMDLEGRNVSIVELSSSPFLSLYIYIYIYMHACMRACVRVPILYS